MKRLFYHVKKARISEAKNDLSALIDGLKSGAPVSIVDRGRPVARLEPVIGAEGGEDGRLSRLVRDGLVRPRRAAPALSLFTTRPPRAGAGASAVESLIAERRESR